MKKADIKKEEKKYTKRNNINRDVTALRETEEWNAPCNGVNLKEKIPQTQTEEEKITKT